MLAPPGTQRPSAISSTCPKARTLCCRHSDSWLDCNPTHPQPPCRPCCAQEASRAQSGSGSPDPSSAPQKAPLRQVCPGIHAGSGCMWMHKVTVVGAGKARSGLGQARPGHSTIVQASQHVDPRSRKQPGRHAAPQAGTSPGHSYSDRVSKGRHPSVFLGCQDLTDDACWPTLAAWAVSNTDQAGDGRLGICGGAGCRAGPGAAPLQSRARRMLSPPSALTRRRPQAMLSAWAAPTTPPPMQLYMQGVLLLLLLLLARSASPACLVGTVTCHCPASHFA